MSALPFVPPLDDFKYGHAQNVSPLVQRVIAENPSKFTYRGTGTYIVGENKVVVIDPGPILESHQKALANALEGREVVGIAITHCHGDHSPLSKWLKQQTGAPTFGIGPHIVGVDPMYDPEDEKELKDEDHKGEVADVDFVPDVVVTDGQVFIEGIGITLSAIHTPGHTSNHMCIEFEEEDTLFTGDHVMGWSSTVITPPDGNMAQYMTSLLKVQDLGRSIWRPTHGNAITSPNDYVAALIAHRMQREQQIVSQLAKAPSLVREIVKDLYADVHEDLHKAAGRIVMAHILKLVDEKRVVILNGDTPNKDSVFALASH